MAAVNYEIRAHRFVSANKYDEIPHKIVASGRLTATTTSPSDVVTVPRAGVDDTLILLIAWDGTVDVLDTDANGVAIAARDFVVSYLGIAETGQTPRPDLDPRALVNGFDGPLRIIVRPGQRFSTLAKVK